MKLKTAEAAAAHKECEQMTCKHLNRLQAQVLNDTKMPERVANKIMQAEGLRERK